jgi:hypothetical protein
MGKYICMSCGFGQHWHDLMVANVYVTQLFAAGLEAGAGRVQQGARARIGAGAQRLQVRTGAYQGRRVAGVLLMYNTVRAQTQKQQVHPFAALTSTKPSSVHADRLCLLLHGHYPAML